jgi:hypothetical protein
VQRLHCYYDYIVRSGWVYMLRYCYCYVIKVCVSIVLLVGTPTAVAWPVFGSTTSCFLSFGMIGCV